MENSGKSLKGACRNRKAHVGVESLKMDILAGEIFVRAGRRFFDGKRTTVTESRSMPRARELLRLANGFWNGTSKAAVFFSLDVNKWVYLSRATWKAVQWRYERKKARRTESRAAWVEKRVHACEITRTIRKARVTGARCEPIWCSLFRKQNQALCTPIWHAYQFNRRANKG